MSDGTHFITIPRHNPVNALTMGGIAKDAGMSVDDSQGGRGNSIEAELFADRLCKRVLDLGVPRGTGATRPFTGFV